MAAARTVLFAPDSFKGSLTSVEVARALAAGWARARPDDELLLSPLADGGEGTLVAIEAAGGWEWRSTTVQDPIGRPTDARWLRSTDGSRAVIELAEASGLSRLALDERDPVVAHTFGTGQMLIAALDEGARSIILGIGGSATSDGGIGLLKALGVVLEDDASITDLDPRLADIELEVACDVTNPVLGPHGAVETYGPQKGATTPEIRAELEANLEHVVDALERATGRRERDTPGAGAAGGVGFGLLALQDRFRSFALRPGVDLVMEATGFAEKLARADLVVTGEGRIDAQTAFGKTALGVARRAREAGTPCLAVGGGVTPEGIDALAAVGAIAVPVAEGPATLEAAIAARTAPVERCAERLARLVSLTKSSD